MYHTPSPLLIPHPLCPQFVVHHPTSSIPVQGRFSVGGIYFLLQQHFLASHPQPSPVIWEKPRLPQ
jgi:hypothetical protein